MPEPERPEHQYGSHERRGDIVRDRVTGEEMARLRTSCPRLRRALRQGGFYMYDRAHAPRIPARLPEFLEPWQEMGRANSWIALGVLLGLLALVVLTVIGGALSFLAPQTFAVVTHTITADCVSAQDMAHAYAWEGDWRDYAAEVERLNGWTRWPVLQLGQRVRVPDYRRKANDSR
jgi:multisubunit Na+/H+ antiporter MnhG subunit